MKDIKLNSGIIKKLITHSNRYFKAVNKGYKVIGIKKVIIGQNSNGYIWGTEYIFEKER